MIRRLVRIVLWIVLPAGLGFTLFKLVQNRRSSLAAPAPATLPFPAAGPAPVRTPAPAVPAQAAPAPWVDPDAGACPSSHPVKAKLGSGIFHLPGMSNYQRTNPDRCYCDAAAAEADGLRPAKR